MPAAGRDAAAAGCAPGRAGACRAVLSVRVVAPPAIAAIMVSVGRIIRYFFSMVFPLRLQASEKPPRLRTLKAACIPGISVL